MTLIIAAVQNGMGYMLSDSRIVHDDGTPSALLEGKAWRTGEMLIGWTGYLRTAQALRYGLTLPTLQEGTDLRAYLCGPFIDAMRQCFKDAGAAVAPKGNGSEITDVALLIVWRGRIFHMESDFSISEHVGAYAIGSGGVSARVALQILDHLPPAHRLRRAAELVAGVLPSVAPPFLSLDVGGPP